MPPLFISGAAALFFFKYVRVTNELVPRFSTPPNLLLVLPPVLCMMIIIRSHYNYWLFWRGTHTHTQMDCHRGFTCGQRPFRPPSWRFATPWPWACSVMNSHLRETVGTPSLCRQSSASGGEIEQRPRLSPEAAEPIRTARLPMEPSEPVVVHRRCGPAIRPIRLRFGESNWCWRKDGRRSPSRAVAACSVRHLPDSDGQNGTERKFPGCGDCRDLGAGAPRPTRSPDPVGNSNC